MIEFVDSLLKFEFCCEGQLKQGMILDILLKYGNMNLHNLAHLTGLSSQQLQAIQDGTGLLNDHEADDLAQLFLTFFGQTFFRKFTLVRNFCQFEPS